MKVRNIRRRLFGGDLALASSGDNILLHNIGRDLLFHRFHIVQVDLQQCVYNEHISCLRRLQMEMTVERMQVAVASESVSWT